MIGTMKKIGLLFIGLTLALLTNGQILKIQGGPSFSKLHWQTKGMNIDPFYVEPLTGYSIFAGLDYLDMQYVNLTTSIGAIRKGGKEEVELIDPFGELTGETLIKRATLDYVSFNTMIELKYRVKERVTPFMGIGPRFDYLVSSSVHFASIKEIDELRNASLGFILGGGIKYDVSRLQFGLRADYYLDFTKIADWTNESTGIGGEVTVNTFTINLALGYRL